jgi:hypothetical protein
MPLARDPRGVELGRFRVGLRVSDATNKADFYRGLGFTEVGTVRGDDPHRERDYPRSCNEATASTVRCVSRLRVVEPIAWWMTSRDIS